MHIQMDILGICPTEISESRGENEIEILKQRETEKCRGRPKHTVISLSQVQFIHLPLTFCWTVDVISVRK